MNCMTDSSAGERQVLTAQIHPSGESDEDQDGYRPARVCRGEQQAATTPDANIAKQTEKSSISFKTATLSQLSLRHQSSTRALAWERSRNKQAALVEAV
jgi:hypothetical protein